ncbi:MAG: SGNH/GDSL hydrolase family protein [Pseudomonadota bacterium]|nr:SGNH/GDSL hydrolase family protein [Pseudomonadota bacterium]
MHGEWLDPVVCNTGTRKLKHQLDQTECTASPPGKPRLRLVLAGFVALLALTELGMRMGGLIEFPVYLRDDYFGYAPGPNQSGRFIRQNDWVFNDLGMGVAEPWKATDRTDVLLIGNSIVLGGNPYDQKDKIAPRIQSHLPSSCALWPVAAGGWTTVNEYRFLERHSDVVAGADFFVWEYMAHQMGGVNMWSRETAHPTQRPTWATGYVVRKALDRRFPSTPRFELRDPDDAAQNYDQFDLMLKRLVEASGRRPAGVIFLYPDQQQLATARSGLEWLADRPLLERLVAKHGLVLIDVASYPQWTAAMYKDGIHPTRDGNALLASILADAVRKHADRC